MDGTHDYQYLCYECHQAFRSTHEVSSCRLCSSQLMYQIQSITFYLKDIDNHQEPLVAWHWRSRNRHQQVELSFMPREPGVVIRLRWGGIDGVPSLINWPAGLESRQLQPTVLNITHCNKWYWCYQCRRPQTLDSNVVSSSSQIIRCHHNPSHRTIKFTDATIISSDRCYWCWRCHIPHVIFSSSSSEDVYHPCSSKGNHLKSMIHVQKHIVIYRNAKSETLVHLSTSWYINPPPPQGPDEAFIEYISDILRTIDVGEVEAIMMGLIPKVKILESHLATFKECSICLEEFEAGKEESELPCKHIYHNKCISPWLRRSYTCPICRHNLCMPIRVIKTYTATDDQQQETANCSIQGECERNGPVRCERLGEVLVTNVRQLGEKLRLMFQEGRLWYIRVRLRIG